MRKIDAHGTLFSAAIFLIIALLLSIALIGALHHHHDGKVHPECSLCAVYTSLSNAIIPIIILLQIVALYCWLISPGLPLFYVFNLAYHKTSRAPPIL